ncbi:hypothetical protein C2I36_03360 [Rhodobacteraceae bacterium WD3A24]|nr:hypothetical protein C2I36_03360 [Rhodobacteraceae bacterium WD3A24]
MTDTGSQDPFAIAIAEDLLRAAPYDAHPPEGRPRDMAAGYATQDRLVENLIAEGRRGPVAGYKIAANAPALMKRFGVSEPASGRVFADQCHESPAQRASAEFHTFALEPEIAAVIGARLTPDHAPFERARIAAAIDRFVPALELLDLRGADMSAVHLPDVVAQNISNAGAVVGAHGVGADDLDTARLHTEVMIDGAPAISVTGGAPQDPVEAVQWLAGHLAARGLTLEPGQIVLCGTHAPMHPVAGPASIELRMSGLGTVEFRLT